jgi:hypothetical protein
MSTDITTRAMKPTRPCITRRSRGIKHRSTRMSARRRRPPTTRLRSRTQAPTTRTRTSRLTALSLRFRGRPSDPPRTGFEDQLAGGKPFPVTVTVPAAVDVHDLHWLGGPPTDPHALRYELVGHPDARLTDQDHTFMLTIDPNATMPVRDYRTGELLGYRVRQGDTLYEFDRNGNHQGGRGLEEPLAAPTIDPIDVGMMVFDLGPVLGKALTAGAGELLAGAARKATAEAVRGPTITRFGAEEVEELSRLWTRRLAAESDPAARQEAEQALKALGDRARIRSWKQSEEEVAHLYRQIGGRGSTVETYVDAAGKARTTVPDFHGPNVRGEVKNWEMVHVTSEEGPNRLLDRLAQQVKARNNLPGPANIPGRTQQTVVVDLRGQALSENDLYTIGHVLAERTGLPVENIQLLVWAD